MNQSYIKATSLSFLIEHLRWHLEKLRIQLDDGPDINELVEFLRDRSKSLVDLAQSCVMFYKDFDDFEYAQANKIFNTNAKDILEDLVNLLSDVDDWNSDNIHAIIESICKSRGVGFGKVGQPFRLALSGDGKSGSIDKSAQFVGKKRTLSRLNMAIDWINSHSS
jgi:glutamyl-tRNA synthetase